MARYNVARDGHPYLTHGYPIIDVNGTGDTRFCTYQCNPGAERLFERAHLEDSDRIPKETFYALLVEGDLYNDARPNGISISSVPQAVLGEAEDPVLYVLLSHEDIANARHLYNLFDVIYDEWHDVAAALSAASRLCLLRHMVRRRR